MSKPEDPPLYEPPFPTPLKKSDKRSWLRLYRRGRKSWIHTLYEGSYKNKLSRIKLPGFQLFIPKQPEVVRKVLTDDYKDFPKHQLMHEMLKPLLGNSVFTTNGEIWERQRRMLDPAFTNAGLKKVFPLMVEAVKDLKLRLDKLSDNEVLSIDVEMTHVTADIIMRTILSEPVMTLGGLEVFRRFEEFQKKASRVNILAAFKLPRWLFPFDYLMWKRRGKQIREVLGAIVSRRYREFNEKDGQTDYGDILEALMQASDEEEGTKFSEVELIDQVVMLFLAGHETSASALSWACHILAHQPKKAEQLAAEAAATYGDLENVKFSEVHKLKNTRDVFRETLRLYPPAAFFGRVATGKKDLGNREIPAGSGVTISPWMIHRHEDVWKEPNAFKPERFNEGENKKCPGAYLPFGQGPRVCIGAAFAQQEGLLVLATLARHYEFTPVEGHEPDAASRLTLRSLNGIKVHISKRKFIPSQESVVEGEDRETEESVGKCPFG